MERDVSIGERTDLLNSSSSTVIVGEPNKLSSEVSAAPVTSVPSRTNQATATSARRLTYYWQ